MIKKSFVIFSIIILFFYNERIYSAKYDGERGWMLRPNSARGAALGNGLVALLDGANTVFWNPAGLVFINEIGFSYTYYYDSFKSLFDVTDIRNKNISFNTTIKGAFSIGLNTSYYYNHGHLLTDILESTMEDYNFGISLGYKIKNIGFGTNIKYLFSDMNKNVYYSKGKVMAVDIGILYVRSYNIIYNCLLNINVGASMINIAKDLNVKYISHYVMNIKTGLPNLFKIGYQTTFNLPKKEAKLNPFSINHNLEYSEIINVVNSNYENGYKFLGYGLEVILYEMVLLRIGNRSLMSKKPYYNMSDRGFSYGFGLNFPLYHFYKKVPLSIKYDYARFPSHPESGVENLHHFKINSFSIQYKF
jgi:hypothetical protein